MKIQYCSKALLASILAAGLVLPAVGADASVSVSQVAYGTINGATAASGSPYFTQQPGQKLYQWDTQLNLQYMPRDWITWWTEATFRHSDVPYWTGTGGVTPPGGNNGSPGSCVGGGPNATGQCSAGDWYPDLRTREVIWGAGVLVKF